MARFVKLTEKDGNETILDLDKIERLTKFVYKDTVSYRYSMGGLFYDISAEEYERIKALLIPPYTRY